MKNELYKQERLLESRTDRTLRKQAIENCGLMGKCLNKHDTDLYDNMDCWYMTWMGQLEDKRNLSFFLAYCKVYWKTFILYISFEL